MRRLPIHAAFAVVTLVCAVFAGYDAVRLVQAKRVDGELAAIAARLPTSTSASVSASHAQTTVEDDAARSHDARPVQLAHAIALSRAGQYAAATSAYEALIGDGPLDEIGRAALFDLANMALRQGAGDAADALRSPQLVEQAKARYRTLLRAAPDDWDARYNLERALRVAPENPADLESEQTATRQDIRLRGAKSEDLP
ncbi:hypothetical protein LJR230_002466 [Trinickia sp. LjRoot230]|uniref:hypothetical protein n=1 Tax=Trinickia sp. LjRoot230 TaxID=3342288 RepID=UPI003ECF0DA0